LPDVATRWREQFGQHAVDVDIDAMTSSFSHCRRKRWPGIATSFPVWSRLLMSAVDAVCESAQPPATHTHTHLFEQLAAPKRLRDLNEARVAVPGEAAGKVHENKSMAMRKRTSASRPSRSSCETCGRP
jgi:hypothetical protein